MIFVIGVILGIVGAGETPALPSGPDRTDTGSRGDGRFDLASMSGWRVHEQDGSRGLMFGSRVGTWGSVLGLRVAVAPEFLLGVLSGVFVEDGKDF